MANSTTSLISGFEYQARYFWLLACELFLPHSKVVRVGYEFDEARGFDDIVLHYREPIMAERGDLVAADHYQVKFHVDYRGAFTWQSLMSPAFIGAASQSLLQKVHAAAREAGSARRFIVLSPWPIHPDDVLAKLVTANGGELRTDLLMRGSARSAMGRVRSQWRAHLGLPDDAALERVLRPLRIDAHAPNLSRLNGLLNVQLQQAGLSPVPAGQGYHPYDDLIWQLRREGLQLFDRQQLQSICEHNGLWRGQHTEGTPVVPLGIRSFMRWAEGMEHETEALLCQVRHFEGRGIRDPELWRTAVYPEVVAFFSRAVKPGGRYGLHLDAHVSTAFAAGYCLDTKCGAQVWPMQRTGQGLVAWKPQAAGSSEGTDGWEWESLPGASSGHDVALALSVTHPVAQDVCAYVAAALSDVGRVLHCTPAGGPGNTAVRDGAHAAALARELSVLLKKERSAQERHGTLHVFAAAPNGLVFFLGQSARSFGPCILYEYDLETNTPEGYTPSLCFPPVTAPGH